MAHIVRREREREVTPEWDNRSNGSNEEFEEVRFGMPPPPPPNARRVRIREPDTFRPPVEGEQFKDGKVPDVLYVVRYHGVGGTLLDVRESDKPLEVQEERNEEEAVLRNKPVIEVMTRVSETYAGTRRSRRRRYDYDNYGSDEDEVFGGGDGSRVSRVETTQMIIHSKYLRNALNAITDYYPGVDFISDAVSVNAPYYALVHQRAALEKYKDNQPPSHSETPVSGEEGETVASLTAKHIDVLLGFLKTTYGEQIDAEEARWKNATPSTTFENFWMALKPGSIMYAKQNSRWTPFVVSRVHHGMRTDADSNDRRTAYTIDCWNIEYTVGAFERYMWAFKVQPFNGEQAFRSLPVIPARFFPEEEGGKAMGDKQTALGKVCWELAKRPAYKEYDGGLVEKDNCNTGTLTGRVIVDCEGYERFRNQGPNRLRTRSMSPPRARRLARPVDIPPKDNLPRFVAHCVCKLCAKNATEAVSPWSGFEDLDPTKDELPANDVYSLVLSDTIPAFVLGERRWAHLQAEYLTEVRPDRESFKYLVLDDEVKLTVKALIGKFASADGKVSPWPNDFVKSKGEGRIFLLHGSPGVGKTCTAECVAELTSRPLLCLTSGDISTSMSSASVERNLSYFLQLGERYGALVLLDEADVYLEERRTKDLHRNGLVSIFLRALEYYRGVLFLTTNRVAAFDSAFTSRIHVALHYRRLTDADRARVWQNNFERLERDSGGRCFVSLATREFARASPEVRRLRWNGREIRNALQTAVALAETEALEDGVEGVNVREEHLRAVVKMSRGFKEFLRKRRGDTDYGDDEEEGDGPSSGEEEVDDGSSSIGSVIDD